MELTQITTSAGGISSDAVLTIAISVIGTLLIGFGWVIGSQILSAFKAVNLSIEATNIMIEKSINEINEKHNGLSEKHNKLNIDVEVMKERNKPEAIAALIVREMKTYKVKG